MSGFDRDDDGKPVGAEDATDCTAVFVGATEARGRGLYISAAGAKGDTVLMERPLVAMQSLDNTQDVTVCRNCLGFAGDVISQLELLAGVPRHECLEHFEERHHGNLPAEHGTLSGLHDCLQGCGEVYCSTRCRAEHFERCHGLLCVGPVPDEEAPTHPLVTFRVHAMQTNEIFLLVGEVVAQIAATILAGASPQTGDGRQGGELTAAEAPFADFVQEHWWDVAVPRESSTTTSPVGDDDESTSVGAATDLDVCREDSSVSLPDTLRALCEESSALLRDALGRASPGLEGIATADRFGRVVGMFEQNNVGVRAPSPMPMLLRELLAQADSGRGEDLVEQAAALVAVLEETEESDGGSSNCDDEEDSPCCGGVAGVDETGCCGGASEEKGGGGGGNAAAPDADVDYASGVRNPVEVLTSAVAAGSDGDGEHELFAPLDGTALYSLVCCMNHSCRPNCVVRYPVRRVRKGVERADPLVAQVILVENVGAGEELTQSYVDKGMGLEERRSALEDYGFLCTCPRCVEEEEAEGIAAK